MLMQADRCPVTGWFVEAAAITRLTPGQQVPQLSGNGMRLLFYFATSPSNENL